MPSFHGTVTRLTYLTLFNDVLHTTVPQHPDAFADVLIPYESSIFLYTDAMGDVAGPEGSSGEPSIAVYQELVLPGWFSNQTSSNITVEAAQ